MSKRRKIDYYSSEKKKFDDKLLLSFRKKIISYITTPTDWNIMGRHTFLKNGKNICGFEREMTLQSFSLMGKKNQINYILRNVRRTSITFFFAHGINIKNDTTLLFEKYISNSPKYKKETKFRKRAELHKLFYGEVDNDFLKRLRESKNINLCDVTELINNQKLCNTLVSKDVMMYKIMPYIKHGNEAIFGVGSACKNLYLMVLMSWNTLFISGNNVMSIPILVIKNTKELYIRRYHKKMSKCGVKHLCDITKDSERTRKLHTNFKTLEFMSRTLQDYKEHGFHNITNLTMNYLFAFGAPKKNGLHENLVSVANKIKCSQILPNLQIVDLEAPFCTLKHMMKITVLTYKYEKWCDKNDRNISNNRGGYFAHQIMNEDKNIVADYPFLSNLTICLFYYRNLYFFLKYCPKLKEIEIQHERRGGNGHKIYDFSAINSTKIKLLRLKWFVSKKIKLDHLYGGKIHRLKFTRWGNYYKRKNSKWRYFNGDGELIKCKNA